MSAFRVGVLILARPVLKILCRPAIDRDTICTYLKNSVTKLENQFWSMDEIDLLPEIYEEEVAGVTLEVEVCLLEYIDERKKHTLESVSMMAVSSYRPTLKVLV
jgi:hypothetical protein